MVRKSMVSIITAAIIGNGLEVYDMVIYGFFASTIAQHFFPKEDRLSGIVSVFAIFFVGYLARPLGALFFGRMGDTLGRKPALSASIGLMAVSTCGIGLIPDYDTIGGPILLLLNLRILQGFSFGGELTGSIIFVVEHAPDAKRGFYGGFGLAGIDAGLLLASFIVWLIHLSFTDAEVVQWAWRLPFLFGFLVGLVGWFVRRRVPGTDLFQETMRIPDNYLTLTFYREYLKHLRYVVINVGMLLFGTVIVYLIYVFIFIYMSNVLQYTVHQALRINIISLIF